MKLVLIPSAYEAAPFLKRLGAPRRKKFSSGLIAYEGSLGKTRVALGVIGMGMPHAALRADDAMAQFAPDMLLLAGFCGALDALRARGDIFLTAAPDGVAAPWTRAKCASVRVAVSTREAREALACETGAVCVDMEQSAVETCARVRRIPFMGVRIVSDEIDETLPRALAFSYDTSRGRYTPLRMAFYLACHPREIPQLRAFLKGLNPVRQKLGDALADYLASGFASSETVSSHAV